MSHISYRPRSERLAHGARVASQMSALDEANAVISEMNRRELRKSRLPVKIAIGVGVTFSAIGFAAGGFAGGVMLGLMFGGVALAFAKDWVR